MIRRPSAEQGSVSASERREASRERTGREGRGGVDVSRRPRLLLPASALAPPQAGITSVDEPPRHYRDLSEGAALAYIVTDAGGRIEEANAEAIRLLGLTPRFVGRKSLFDYLPVKDRHLFREALKQRMVAYASAMGLSCKASQPAASRYRGFGRKHHG